MNLQTKFARIMRNSGPARVLVPVGIILIIFGVITLMFNTRNFLVTTGKVTSVVEEEGDKDTEYDVTFTYTVDGKQYEGTFYDLLRPASVGDDIEVYYDPADPEKITNGKNSPVIGIAEIALGIAAAAYGTYKTVMAFRKSSALDKNVPENAEPVADLSSLKDTPGVTEYYFRFDGNSLKPGYLIEDAERKILFEGKMLRNSIIGDRTFEFTDHTTGAVNEYEVGHTMTQSYNDEFFSVNSWFKFDGRNIWDMLHGRGVRITTDILSKLPRVMYNVLKDGEPFARIETASIYLHEDEEAKHKVVIPYGKMYYRCWSPSGDLETLFLIMFAITETEQAIVE